MELGEVYLWNESAWFLCAGWCMDVPLLILILKTASNACDT